MKIQNRLTLLFSFLFGVILFAFIVGVYQFYSNRCKEDYFERLHLRGVLKVDLIDEKPLPLMFSMPYMKTLRPIMNHK